MGTKQTRKKKSAWLHWHWHTAANRATISTKWIRATYFRATKLIKCFSHNSQKCAALILLLCSLFAIFLHAMQTATTAYCCKCVFLVHLCTNALAGWLTDGLRSDMLLRTGELRLSGSEGNMRQNRNTTSDWKERKIIPQHLVCEKQNYIVFLFVVWYGIFVQLSADISRSDFFVCSNFFCAILEFLLSLCSVLMLVRTKKHRVNRFAYVERRTNAFRIWGFLLFGTYDAGPNRFGNCEFSLRSPTPDTSRIQLRRKWMDQFTVFFFCILHLVESALNRRQYF